MNPLAANIEAIRARIEDTCQRCDRDPQEVRLIAVSKVKPAALVEQAFAAGQQLFGENYVQEFRTKSEEVKAPVSWHFIGALQSNKVKSLRGKVAMIHSVDRLSLAEEIDRQWAKLDTRLDILLQVNIGDEESKAGCPPEQLESLVRQVAQLKNLRIRGFMCLPPYADDAEEVRPYFRRMRELRDAIAALDISGVETAELSMGMSGDFPVAIEEGATLVRVGTAIFGQRRKD